MHDVVRVQNHESVQDAPQDGGRILLRVVPSLLDLVKELLAIEMLQNQVDIVVRLENLIKLQDIGVTNFS